MDALKPADSAPAKAKTAIAAASKGGVKKRIRRSEAGKAHKGQQSMRQAVRSLKGLLGLRAKYLHMQLRRRYPTYADKAGSLKQAGSHAFLHVVLGGDTELWPRKEELKEDGVTVWLARLLSWAADENIKPNDVNKCFKEGGKNSYETNDEWLNNKRLFAWNWTFPLTRASITTTAAEPARQSVQLSEEETQRMQHAIEAAVMLYPPGN